MSANETLEGVPPRKRSWAKRLAWAFYALVVLAGIVGVNWQNYRILTGKVESALPLKSEAVSEFRYEVVERPAPQREHADTEQVRQLLAAQEVSLSQLGGDEKRVTFRSQGGNIVCTLAADLSANPPSLLPLPAVGEGSAPQAPGAVCETLRPFQSRAGGNVGQCAQGTVHLFGLGVWNGGSGAGVCSEGRPPLQADAVNHKQPGTGERFEFKQLGISQAVFLGDYGCLMESIGVSCMNYKTGRGFTFQDGDGYSFF